MEIDFLSRACGPALEDGQTPDEVPLLDLQRGGGTDRIMSPWCRNDAVESRAVQGFFRPTITCRYPFPRRSYRRKEWFKPDSNPTGFDHCGEDANRPLFHGLTERLPEDSMDEFRGSTSLTVLLGPNGSGNSTVFDVFAFLAECFAAGSRRAWDRRGRAKELKTRSAEEAVGIEIEYRERPGIPLMTYHLDVDEQVGGPVVVREWLAWKRGRMNG